MVFRNRTISFLKSNTEKFEEHSKKTRKHSEEFKFHLPAINRWDRQTKKCKECGSENFLQNEIGRVCLGCGLVQEGTTYIVEYPIYYRDQNSLQLEFQTQIGRTETQIGHSKERTVFYARLNSLNARETQDRYNEAQQVFRKLTSNFDLLKWQNDLMKFFQTAHPRIPKGIAAKNINLFCTTIFYRYARSRHVSIPLRPLLQYMDIELSQYFSTLHELNKIKLFEAMHNPQEDLELAKNLILLGDSKLNLGSERVRLGLMIIEKFSNLLGYTPQIIAGTTIAIILKILPPTKKIKLYQVAKILRISSSTIYSRIKLVPNSLFFAIERYTQKGELKKKRNLQH